MKNLSLDGGRLALVIPDLEPLRAAAVAVRGSRFLGVNDGHVVYEYPGDPDIAEALALAFEPTNTDHEVTTLLFRASAMRDTLSAKDISEPFARLPLRTAPYSHQVQAINFCWARWQAGAKGTALLMEMGTGKSLVAIALAGLLQERGQIEWVLTVCPNSLRGVWAAADGEVALHGEWPGRAYTLEGTRSQRADHMERLLIGQTPWIVTNYDQFSVDTGARSEQGKVFRKVLDSVRGRPGLLILDESSYVKNMRARRTRAIAQLTAAFPYRLLLNGTPITRSPLDAFGQFEVMEQGCLGFNSYLAFERKYALYEPVRVAGGRMVQVPSSYQNLEDLERRMSALSFRARAAECLDLPPVIVSQIPVVLSPEQRLAYQQLTSDMIAKVDAGHFLDGRNILARYGKLAQVVGGFAHTVDGDGQAAGVKVFDPNPKMTALTEYLDLLFEDPAAKAVVFCAYVAEVEQILSLSEQRGWQPAAMYGTVRPLERESGRQRFDSNPACRIMVCQYQCGSKGLNLTAANTVVFYSLTFSLEDYLQAQKRVHRAGQTAEHVNEVYLIAQREIRGGELRPTIDHLILGALRDKKDLADICTGDRARDTMAAL